MEVEIISTECIKPSSPTPPHLRTYKFCLLDQFFDLRFLAPVIHFYPADQNTYLSTSTSSDVNHNVISKRLQALKQSLPHTLTRFYPMAGKIKDALSIDCNDEGIYFVEAQVKSPLRDFLSQTDLTCINKLTPFDFNERGGPISGLHAAKLQVTTFSCGGLAICTCHSHLLGDATSILLFVKSWAAAACKNAKEMVCPNYNAPFLFPQNDAFPRELTWGAIITKFSVSRRVVTQRFVFDAKAIATLKTKATSSRVPNPTRSEVVLAFLSKCIMNVRKNKIGFKPTLLATIVNLRPRIARQRSKYLAGNMVWEANVMCTDEKEDLESLVHLLRKSIVAVNEDVVKHFEGEGGFLELCEAVKNSNREYSSAADKLQLNGLVNMGWYDIDFGWGKPIWFSFPYTKGFVPNSFTSINLLNTRSGYGIEAWLYGLSEEEVNLLQHDEEFLALVAMNPSPLSVDHNLSTSRL